MGPRARHACTCQAYAGTALKLRCNHAESSARLRHMHGSCICACLALPTTMLYCANHTARAARVPVTGIPPMHLMSPAQHMHAHFEPLRRATMRCSGLSRTTVQPRITRQMLHCHLCRRRRLQTIWMPAHRMPACVRCSALSASFMALF
jgi:hypothetical protein